MKTRTNATERTLIIRLSGQNPNATSMYTNVEWLGNELSVPVPHKYAGNRSRKPTEREGEGQYSHGLKIPVTETATTQATMIPIKYRLRPSVRSSLICQK
jgi:hypothetical protein